MFTGIVKALGEVVQTENREGMLRYALSTSQDFIRGLEKGASVSVEGVCQTVVEIQDTSLWFEAISETLQRTTFKEILKKGMPVNLERSAKIGDEIGGHLLSGHIFCKARICQIENNIYHFECPPSVMKYLFSKGFVALDGVSLTLVDIDKKKNRFTIHSIPETLARTTLGQKKIDAYVNVEIDAQIQAIVDSVQNFIFSLA